MNKPVSRKRTNFKSKCQKKDVPKCKFDSDVKNEKFNDPSWYVKSPQMVKDVASLSFNNALGAPVRIDSELHGTTINHTTFDTIVPGIATILTVPAMGIARTGADPINIAAKNIYSWVRHQNSGHANYDAPDLMLYLGAMDSIYAAIATLMRVYGTARTFSQVNRYIGDALIRAQGFNPTEIRANLANFRAYINMVITKVSAFCTPNVMSLYRRHFWMFSGIYKDEDIEKSQLYIYRPAALWQYMLQDGKGSLTSRNFLSTWNSEQGVITHAVWTLQQVQDFIGQMISQITNSEDMNIMSGDILKAYGRENLWVLGLIPEDYAVLPVYSSEVLSQIHNTTFIGNKPTYGNNAGSTTTVQFGMSAFDVTQNVNPEEDGRLVFSPQVARSAHLTYQRLLDLYSNDPSPEDVIVSTRNMVMGHDMYVGPTGSQEYVTEIDTCGSDLALFMLLYAISSTASAGVSVVTIGTGDIQSLDQTYYRFKGAPLMYLLNSSNGSGSVTNFTGDINNYTVIGYDELHRMHESAILSMLGVPFYGLAQA